MMFDFLLQEDAHICNPSLENNSSLYAVFDGHGGIEVADFCAQNMEQVLLSQ